MSRRIVLFELNEVPWRIVDEFVVAEPRSALARILSTSSCFTSLTADRGHLSPWTTWPTLHRGVNDERHMIANFGQSRSAADEQFPPVWELLHRAGLPVGICGTLHTYPVPPDIQAYSFYLPDTFASEPTAFPAELETFQAFNLTMARASSRNVDTAIPRAAALTLLRSAHRLGIRPGTFAALAQQLVAERRKPWLTTRRRSLQSLLAFDVFDSQLRRHRPAFSTFFSNHVASAMHRYWAAGHPADYDQLDLGEDWLQRYRGEVPWAMRRADDMIARLADFVQANPGSELWIASSMGQGPTFAQPLETQLYLDDLPAFMFALGSASGPLPADRWSERPAMLPQRNVRVDPEYADGFEAALRSVTVAGAPLLFRRADDGFFSMDWGQSNLNGVPDAVRVAGQVREAASLGLRVVEIEDRSDTTAYHVPQGVLAIYDPQHPVAGPVGREELSVLHIAPTILATLGVPVPDYMQAPITEMISA